MYTVKVYGTPMPFPINFALHTWVEISHNKATTRYDLWAYPGITTTPTKGYIYINLFPDHLGTTLSPFERADALTKRQPGRILGEISGDKESLAYKLYTAIQNDALTYPYADTYRMIWGPNCNTFTAWLISLVPEAGLRLPWSAWGKNYTQ
jgi:hypothetical protein